MFLHLGADVVVSLKRVVAIIDLKSSQTAASTRDFVARSQRAKAVVDVAGGDAKSLVLTEREVYLSPISSLTLMKRAHFLSNRLVRNLDGTSS